jgi:hypothetical protein
MALDHYVSQVYLKNFYSTDMGPLMHAIKKSDLKYFTPDSDSVCRIEKGNTNPFLAEERIIEEFLKSIEPNYNRAVDALLEENFRNDVLYTIAGLVAYIQTCSPTGVQISKKHMETMIEDAGKIFDQQGKITPLPEELGGKTFTELLNQGSVNVEVDPKYSQAIGISSIINTLSFFANCHWDIIINEYEDSTFFSSDFPIGFERSKDPLIINKIFPLRPDVAIRIKPHMNINTDKPDYEFPEFRYRVIKPKRKEVVEINRLLVRCAENMVFFNKYQDWIFPFIKKNSKYHIKSQVYEAPAGSSKYQFFTSRVEKNYKKT